MTVQGRSAITPLNLNIGVGYRSGARCKRDRQRLTIEEAIEGTWAPVPSEGEPEADAGRLATLPTPEAIASEPWPHQDPDGSWRDASGAAYDPAQHGWSVQENRPSVTDRGLFRSRRGSTPRPGPRRPDPERPAQDGSAAGAAEDWSIE